MTEHITREEFESVRETVHDTATTVNRLVPTVETLVGSVQSLTSATTAIRDEIAEHRNPRGVSVSSIFAALAVMATWSVICGGLVVQHVSGQLSPMQSQIQEIRRDHHNHVSIGSHRGAGEKLSELETMLMGLSAENETQHRWLADVLKLQADLTRMMANPDYKPQHQPLRDIGDVSSVGGK